MLLSVGISLAAKFEDFDWDQLSDLDDSGLFSPLDFIDFFGGDMRSDWETYVATAVDSQTTTTSTESVLEERPLVSLETAVKRRKYALNKCAVASDELRCAVIHVMISSRPPVNDEELMDRVHEHCRYANLEDVRAIQYDIRLYAVKPLIFHDLLMQNTIDKFTDVLEGDLAKHIRVWSVFCINALKIWTNNGSKGWKPCMTDTVSETVRLSHSAMNHYLHDELNALF